MAPQNIRIEEEDEEAHLEEGDALDNAVFIEPGSSDASIVYLPCSSLSSDQIDAEESQPPPAKKRRRMIAEKRCNPFGINGGVYFDRREDGKYVPRVILPRILRTDVRRKYAQMFANVFNSCDSSQITHYMDTFCRQDFFFQQDYSGAKSPSVRNFIHHIADIGMHTLHSLGAKAGAFSGLQTCQEFWKEMTSSSYDSLFELLMTRIKARSDGTSVVEFKFRLSGSFFPPVIDLHVMAKLAEMREVGRTLQSINAEAVGKRELLQSMQTNFDAEHNSNLPFSSLSEGVSGTDDREAKEPLRFPLQELGICFPDGLRSTSKLLKYDILGTASMHLDSDNKIYLMTFQASA